MTDYDSDLDHTIVVLVKYGGIFGQRYDDEITQALFEVVDERGNMVGVDSFERIEQYD